jgi:hypothetical protein
MKILMKSTVVALGLLGSVALAPIAAARDAAAPAVANLNVTEAEVLAAQKAWGEALVRISKDYDEGGLAQAKATAAAVLDAAYGYSHGPVLFKPTLAADPQTFRTTRDGALAYFVGADPRFPGDTGFALKGWRAVDVANSGILIDGDTAMTMGKVTLTDKNGTKTTVDKTWVFKKDDRGQLRIVVHHSSLPYATKS